MLGRPQPEPVWNNMAQLLVTHKSFLHILERQPGDAAESARLGQTGERAWGQAWERAWGQTWQRAWGQTWEWAWGQTWDGVGIEAGKGRT